MQSEQLHTLNTIAHQRRAIKTKDFEKMPIMQKRVAFPYFGYVDVALPDCPPIVLFSNNDEFVALQIFWNGCHEPMSVALWSVLAQSNTGAVLDVGAYAGLFSLLACAVAPTNPIVAFEPIDRNYARTLLNVQANDFQRLIQVRNEAAGAADAQAQISMFRDDDLLPTGSSLNHPRKETQKQSLSISLRSVDSVCKEMALEKIGLVKIDAEHFEVDVLNGMAETIRSSGPDILVEVANANFEKVIQTLQTAHPEYNCFQVNENRCKLIHNASVKAQGCRNLFFTLKSGAELQRVVNQSEARAKRYVAANT